MKQAIVLSLILLSFFPATAQVPEGFTIRNYQGQEVPMAKIRETCEKKVEKFKLAVKATALCERDFDFRLFCRQYMDSAATIEVINPRSNHPKPYPALTYFDRLRKAFCEAKIYEHARFDFPNLGEKPRMERDEHHKFRVRYPINQVFTGYDKTGAIKYADITLKEVVIDFEYFAGEYYQAKITKVVAIEARELTPAK